MCIQCAYNCRGDSLYDLYLSSKNCKIENHSISRRPSLLKGYGTCRAAVEYINASIQIHAKDYFGAQYHSKVAIKYSEQYSDNLNKCVAKLAQNLLTEVNERKNKKDHLFYLRLLN